MFKFTWYIENFSMLSQTIGEFIDSPIFEITTMNNLKAYIRLYPKGQKISGYENIIYGPRLVKESQCFEHGTKVELSFTKNSNSEFKSMLVTSSRDNSTICHLLEKDTTEYINNFQDLFSCSDNVEIECFLRGPNFEASSTVECCAKTTLQTETHTHDLLLRNKFDSSMIWKDKHEYSKTFSVEKPIKFQHILKFQNHFANNTVEIRKTSKIPSAVVMCCKVSLIGSDEKSELICGRHLFKSDAESDSWKNAFDISASSMEEFTSLRCEIIVSKGNTSDLEANNTINSTLIPRNILRIESKNGGNVLLKNMYETKKFSDAILQVGTEQIPVHKCVIGNVSDVFAAMFATKIREEETNVVNIKDIDKDVVRKLLQFVYLGEIENMDRKSLEKLYCAAHEYQILELKKLCSFYLTETLCMTNVLEVLKLANMKKDSVLVEAACSFIYANRKEVLNSDHWICFMEQCKNLAADIMFRICKSS